jgi:polyphosphate kinase 2 (PPK2 family)
MKKVNPLKKWGRKTTDLKDFLRWLGYQRRLASMLDLLKSIEQLRQEMHDLASMKF